ncbi:MAG TPA: endonuclease/exonuclease/phosphatase family protein [Ureibacillus sp.]|uniref:endonuclease/exonuclease/phosphatase family protein n=1 Tax=Peribacillus asahii TaxID=228899 RepID=UPI0020796002|nr:endonuclease/exonuclease/phosphatase family protein [Peribacillus asahii]USK59198.1 endonuclease/exonuclease/phosphatase family protein [Peribacillus asahii]HWL26046.1 endonuclease/exonuclease/phosphatase family protein [Ureibacillus sp.]
MNSKSNLKISFLTWNIYQGFNVAPLLAASPEQIPAVVTQIFRQFLATNFPVRAKAIAEAIASEKPDFIGLQEAARVELIIPTFRTVTYDFIEILLEALEERGLNYEVVAQNPNFSTQLPDNNGNLVRFLDRDAILIRKDKDLKVIRRQEANFQTNLIVSVGGQPFTILRGWSSIDVKIDRQVFRIINTHLEPAVEAIRNAQANEILQGPANTRLPVVITGDLNAIPNSSTYNLFINAGFKDVWNEVGEGPGVTCCQDPDLLNAVSMLNRRVDYILFKNGWKPIEVELVGESQGDRTKTGLWPSDHAGVSAKLNLGDHHNHHHGESRDESSN